MSKGRIKSRALAHSCSQSICGPGSANSWTAVKHESLRPVQMCTQHTQLSKPPTHQHHLTAGHSSRVHCRTSPMSWVSIPVLLLYGFIPWSKFIIQSPGLSFSSTKWENMYSMGLWTEWTDTWKMFRMVLAIHNQVSCYHYPIASTKDPEAGGEGPTLSIYKDKMRQIKQVAWGYDSFKSPALSRGPTITQKHLMTIPRINI